MEFSQRTTQLVDDQQWIGRNVAVRDGGIELVEKSSGGNRGSTRHTEGVVYRQFDAGSQAVQWHRLVVDHEQSGAGTQFRVAYLASDASTPLDEPLADVCGLSDAVCDDANIETVWELLASEPSELSAQLDHSTEAIANAHQRALAALEAATDGRWQTADATDEILLADATGQYLLVRIELVGSQQATPRLESVRASWPRQSYLEYLPEIYQKQHGDDVLEQFLAVFGTLFTDLEREIETVTELFDPQAVPADALPWLAEWLGVETAAKWPTPAIRKQLARAPDHQSTRGTKDSLRNMLALYLAHIDPAEPLDSEAFVPSENTAVGMDVDLTEVDHGLWILEQAELDEIGPAAADAYRRPFSAGESVVVYAGPFDHSDHKRAVERILDCETPAHVESRLIDLDDAWRLGVDGFLSETTQLADSGFELGVTTLGATAEVAAQRVDSTAEID